MYYVTENKRTKFLRVIDQRPSSKNERLIATCDNHHDAFVVLDLHDSHRRQEKTLIQTIIAMGAVLALIGILVALPDAEPPKEPEKKETTV